MTPTLKTLALYGLAGIATALVYTYLVKPVADGIANKMLGRTGA